VTSPAPATVPGRRVGWRTCALGLVLYVTFLAASSPAALFGWGVSAATGGMAHIEQPSGTFWRGNAEALVVTDQWNRAHRYARPHWEFFLSRALAGKLQAAVVIDDQQVRGRALVNYQPRGIGINEVDLEMPAEKLAAHLPMLAPAKLSGRVSLKSDDFLVGRDTLAGKAVITWRRAATELSAVNPLGDYAAQISASGRRLEVALDTTRGPLRMEGRGTWSVEGGLTFSGTASAPPDRERELEAFLKLLGPKVGGAHLLRIGAVAAAAR